MASTGSHGERQRFEVRLRQAIADALHAESAYDLPACCERLGLATGSDDEAFASKRTYVKKRLQAFSESALLELAGRVLELHDDAELRDIVSERLLPIDQRLSEITRRKILAVLNGLPELFGNLGRGGLRERLDVLAPSWMRSGPSQDFPRTLSFKTLSDEFEQHYLLNDDWDHAELLEACGALTCAQDRFMQLLNLVLRPEARTDAEQERLVRDLDAALKPDGYGIDRVASVSGHGVYEVVRRHRGVAGQAKNLIFASSGAKPDIVLRDAVNNDVEITRNADLCLIYDRHIDPSSGLTWFALAEWWKDKNAFPDLELARKSLGDRLRKSLSIESPGEAAIFRTYFEEFLPRMGARLPALLPQVYLHFDPLSARQRAGQPVLARQRMDFLLLLPDGVRVVVEVDGRHHYAVGTQASPERYAEMIVEDRQLRLRGYELFRFGGAEFADTEVRQGAVSVGPRSAAAVKEFFDALFTRFGMLQK